MEYSFGIIYPTIPKLICCCDSWSDHQIGNHQENDHNCRQDDKHLHVVKLAIPRHGFVRLYCASIWQCDFFLDFGLADDLGLSTKLFRIVLSQPQRHAIQSSHITSTNEAIATTTAALRSTLPRAGPSPKYGPRPFHNHNPTGTATSPNRTNCHLAPPFCRMTLASSAGWPPPEKSHPHARYAPLAMQQEPAHQANKYLLFRGELNKSQ